MLSPLVARSLSALHFWINWFREIFSLKVPIVPPELIPQNHAPEQPTSLSSTVPYKCQCVYLGRGHCALCAFRCVDPLHVYLLLVADGLVLLQIATFCRHLGPRDSPPLPPCHYQNYIELVGYNF